MPHLLGWINQPLRPTLSAAQLEFLGNSPNTCLRRLGNYSLSMSEVLPHHKSPGAHVLDTEDKKVTQASSLHSGAHRGWHQGPGTECEHSVVELSAFQKTERENTHTPVTATRSKEKPAGEREQKGSH